MGFFLDTTYVLVFIGALISIWASCNVKRTYKKFSKYGNSKHITAEEAVRVILNGAGIYDVRIERVSGNLTDHYSPNEKVLRLSDTVYGSQSVAAIGVAAHECGHVIQHNEGYGPIKVRAAVIPLASIGLTFSWPVVIMGLILGWTGFMNIGIILFSLVIVFQLVTLPVEFDASNRALRILEANRILYNQELNAVRKVLFAAALTYVAALLSSILQLARILLLRRRK